MDTNVLLNLKRRYEMKQRVPSAIFTAKNFVTTTVFVSLAAITGTQFITAHRCKSALNIYQITALVNPNKFI